MCALVERPGFFLPLTYVHPVCTLYDMRDKRRTKIFRNGNSKAVRIPGDFEVNEGDAFVEQRGNQIVITPLKRTLGEIMDSLTPVSEDFMSDGRKQPRMDEEPSETLFD